MNLSRFLPVFLTGGTTTFDISSVMTDAVASVQGDMFKVLLIAVPAIVGIVGAVVAFKFGIKWLKSLGKN